MKVERLLQHAHLFRFLLIIYVLCIHFYFVYLCQTFILDHDSVDLTALMYIYTGASQLIRISWKSSFISVIQLKL